MNIQPSRLEQFPNEILLDLFQYFDARDLFRIFYNLNFRFNQLIKSFHHLNLSFHMKLFDDNLIDQNHIFPSYVHSLIVGYAININLNRFSNIHYLRLECPLKRVLAQLNSNLLPHLKHLSISHLDVLTTTDEWISLPSLRSLKVSCITTSVYKAILSACPNLVSLELDMFSLDRLISNTEPHINLKRLIINIRDLVWPWDDHIFDSYLCYVPHLEEFTVYRSIFMSKITESLLKYDWLGSKIGLYLLSLRRFYFYLKVIVAEEFIERDIEIILSQIKEIFNNHHDRYKSRIVIY